MKNEKTQKEIEKKSFQVEKDFYFPKFNKTVKAVSLEEALAKLRKEEKDG